MRHIRSILYSLVLAPAAWVLTAVGLTGDLTARGRDGFAVENFTGLLLLLLAGAAYGILVLGPFSPAGPLLAGVVYLAISAWALTSPSAYADVWSPSVAKDGFDLSRPGYGLAAILAVPLICTALSARRWAKYEPPVLPLIGQIGRASGAARAHGTPLSNDRTTVISAGLSIMDPEPTTVLRLPSADSTTAVVSAAMGHQWDEDPTTTVVPAALGRQLDDDPTIVWATPNALAAMAAADEDTVASPSTAQPLDEPITVVDVSAGEPTVAVADEDPTELVTDSEPTQVTADEQPTELMAQDEPAEIAAEEEPTEAVAESGDDEVTEAELADGEVTDTELADGEIAEPTATADADEPEDAEGSAGEATAANEVAEPDEDEDEETAAALVAGADRTEVIRLPVADDGEKTQVVRLPVADKGERTQVVRLPVAEVVPFPAVDPDEKTQVIRLSQVLQFPVRSPEAEPGQRTRDLSNRATGDVGGDETQVIRLAAKTVDDEKTQVIRPALVTRPDDRSDVLPFRAPTLRDATPPSTADPEPSAPVTNASTPIANASTPIANASAPIANASASTANASTPIANASAPITNAPTAGVAVSTPDADEPKTTVNIKAPASIADAEAPNFADDPTSPISLSSRNGDEATEAHSRSMTVMKMERPPDDAAEETTHLEIPAQRRPGTGE